MEKNAPSWVNSETSLQELFGTKERLIVLWYASWCPFCTAFLPLFRRHAAEARVSEWTFALVQDDEETLAESYGVEVFPTLLCLEKGQVRRRLDATPRVGLTEDQLVDFIRDSTTAATD